MKHIESGRSFVEMLGVLAVMGIISIGGLYGYTQAMKRHRANELLNEANKRAVMVATELMAGKKPGDVTMDEVNTPYGRFTSSLEDVGDKFKMTVSGLDEEVCALMEGLAGGPIRRVKCVGEETSTFTAEMYFNKDLSTEERASDYTYDNCPNKFYKCDATHTCVASAAECQVTCEVLECVHGTWNEAECKCDCDTNWYGKICDSDCDGWKSVYGHCLPCLEDGVYEIPDIATPEECARCDNRAMIVNTDGVTVCATTYCTSGYFRDVYGGCSDCDGYESVETDSSFCAACDNTDYPRKIFTYNGKSYCGLKDCPYYTFRGSDGSCYYCTTGEYIEASVDECNVCNDYYPRRMVVYNGKNYCALPECDQNEFRSNDGACALCSQQGSEPAHLLECARCDNRKIFTYNGKSYCGLKECGNGSFRDLKGSCLSCYVTGKPRETTLEECAKCGTKRIYDESTGLCSLR